MENRIELERRGRNKEQIAELNLDNCRSTSIVGLSDEYRNLEILSLINVGLTSLKGIPALTDLRKLELSDNRISNGLDYLLKTPNLTHLSLSGNKLKDIESLQPLAKLSKLKSLDLFNCEITTEKDYRSKVFELLPQLCFLDGTDKEGQEDAEEESEDDEEGEEEDEDEMLDDDEIEGFDEEDEDEEGLDEDGLEEGEVAGNVGDIEEGEDDTGDDDDEIDPEDELDDEDEEGELDEEEVQMMMKEQLEAGEIGPGGGATEELDEDEDEEDEDDEEEEPGLAYLAKEDLSDEEDDGEYVPGEGEDEEGDDDLDESIDSTTETEAAPHGTKRKHEGDDDDA